MLLVVRSGRTPRRSTRDRAGRRRRQPRWCCCCAKQGATVDVIRAAPAPGAGGRVLVLDDRLDDGRRATCSRGCAAGEWRWSPTVEPLHGGHPSCARSRCAPRFPGRRPDRDVRAESDIDRGECTIGALRRAARRVRPRRLRFDVGDDAPHCFAAGGLRVRLHRTIGDGVIGPAR